MVRACVAVYDETEPEYSPVGPRSGLDQARANESDCAADVRAVRAFVRLLRRAEIGPGQPTAGTRQSYSVASAPAHWTLRRCAPRFSSRRQG